MMIGGLDPKNIGLETKMKDIDHKVTPKEATVMSGMNIEEKEEI